LRIHVVRSGGIAGLRSEVDLDTSQLPGDAGSQLVHLVQVTSFFGLATELRTKLPDMTQYRVRIEHDGQAHEVCFDDATSDTSLLELVERVSELARAGAG
jgi:hypothetical protein